MPKPGDLTQDETNRRKDPNRQDWAKKLQIVEMAIKTQRSWQGRSGSAEKANAEFESNFEIMRSFADSAPAQHVDCDYLWRLRLQLQVCRDFLSLWPQANTAGQEVDAHCG
jgi:hypothetical protein